MFSWHYHGETHNPWSAEILWVKHAVIPTIEIPHLFPFVFWIDPTCFTCTERWYTYHRHWWCFCRYWHPGRDIGTGILALAVLCLHADSPASHWSGFRSPDIRSKAYKHPCTPVFPPMNRAVKLASRDLGGMEHKPLLSLSGAALWAWFINPSIWSIQVSQRLQLYSWRSKPLSKIL